MPAIQILSLALGLAFISGINLYLTTFLAGLAGRMGWLDLAAAGGPLQMVSHPAVMTVAFLLFLLEAFVDKVPWVDSLWDALHTVIRPAGAVLLALEVMGNADPAYKVIAGILAGTAGITTHLTKAGLRLLINTSPEPLSNILTSIAEDLVVAGLFALLVWHPVAGLITCVAMVVVLWMLLPKLFRLMKANLYLMWKKLRLPGHSESRRVELPSRITADQDIQLHGLLTGPLTVAWAVPCITGRSRGFPGLVSNTFGTLVSVREHPGALVFLTRRWFRHSPSRLSLPGCDVQHESTFLSENLVVYNRSEKRQATFRFVRGSEALAAQLEKDLRRRLKSGVADAPEPAALPEPDPVAEVAALTTAPAAPLFTEIPVLPVPEPAPTVPSSEPEPAAIAPFPPASEPREPAVVSEPAPVEPAPLPGLPPMPIIEPAAPPAADPAKPES